MPQAFPADAERTKASVADNDSAAIAADKPAVDIASARSAAVPAPPPPATIARGDAGSAAGRLAKEADAGPTAGRLAKETDAATRTPAPAPSAPAARAAPNGRGATPTAPSAANGGAPVATAQDPDAWIARIRKLYDDGRPQDAAKELVAMRSAFPDADGRLPESMRAWAATVKQ